MPGKPIFGALLLVLDPEGESEAVEKPTQKTDLWLGTPTYFFRLSIGSGNRVLLLAFPVNTGIS